MLNLSVGWIRQTAPADARPELDGGGGLDGGAASPGGAVCCLEVVLFNIIIPRLSHPSRSCFLMEVGGSALPAVGSPATLRGMRGKEGRSKAACTRCPWTCSWWRYSASLHVHSRASAFPCL